MTLIVAMKSDRAIILSADSRGTYGDPRGLTAINDNMVKLFPFGKCGVAFAGASEMGATLLDELRKKGIDKAADDIETAKQDVVAHSANLFAEWFKDIPPNGRPGVLMTLVGYRKTPDGKFEPKIYLLNSQLNFAPQLIENLPSLTGVPQYAIYLANRYYDATITVDRAKALSEYLISETASQDPKVGGAIRMAEVTPGTGYRELSREEVSGISKANAELNDKLKQFFLKGVPQ